MEAAREVGGEDQEDQPCLMNFIFSVLKRNVLLNARWRGWNVENLQASIGHLALLIQSIVRLPPSAQAGLSQICFTNFQFNPPIPRSKPQPFQPRQLGGVQGDWRLGGVLVARP